MPKIDITIPPKKYDLFRDLPQFFSARKLLRAMSIGLAELDVQGRWTWGDVQRCTVMLHGFRLCRALPRFIDVTGCKCPKRGRCKLLIVVDDLDSGSCHPGGACYHLLLPGKGTFLPVETVAVKIQWGAPCRKALRKSVELFIHFFGRLVIFSGTCSHTVNCCISLNDPLTSIPDPLTGRGCWTPVSAPSIGRAGRQKVPDWLWLKRRKGLHWNREILRGNWDIQYWSLIYNLN